MRFIQCAPQHGKPNLQLYQCDGCLYYYAFKDIQVGQELLLLFSDKYPHYLSLIYDIRGMSSSATESQQG